MWKEGILIFSYHFLQTHFVAPSLVSAQQKGRVKREKRRERSQDEQLMHGNSSQKGLSQSPSEECAVKVNFKWKNNLTRV